MGIGMILLTILLFAVCTVLTLVGYYLGSGEWLWKSNDKDDRRNWPPGR
ncbi:MAG TPA: hypothetical protein VNN15_05730 [Solirubrobacterales bacterium]|nr:hypothetical protein [Solirubrobacterales bacterium]